MSFPQIPPSSLPLTPDAIAPSSRRAWLYLVRLSIRRQARIREMSWIALGLLSLVILLVFINAMRTGWNMGNWHPRRSSLSYNEWTVLLDMEAGRVAALGSPQVMGLQNAITASCRAALDRNELYVFSIGNGDGNGILFLLVVNFLLPIWSLSFATEALGSEREGSNMVWLMTRPLSRPAIYLAKYVAQLPWSLGLSLGGFGLVCLAAGKPGPLAFRLYWPAILFGTLAFSALFHLSGAIFRRPVIVGLVYSFFLEVLLGNMPGYLKRVSISFYVRCMMFDAGQDYGVVPDQPLVYNAVDGLTALVVLALGTLAFLGLGMWLFSRAEFVGMD